VVGRFRRLGEHTLDLAKRLDTVHIDLTWHPAGQDPDMYSRDGLHGNGRSQAICAAEAVRRLGSYLGNTFTGGS